MQTPTFDPGLTQKYTGSVRRIINKDGQFNVKRKGVNWRDIHPYLYMINAPWPRFLLYIFIGYLAMNCVFAFIYWLIGAQHLTGAAPPTEYGNFVNAFFFSAHTLTTVGYGNMFPQGIAANSVAAVEALFGLMTFALATGLLFGRFSRPAARLGFSERMIIAPYGDGTSLQFRVANRRSNNLMELEARLLLMTVENVSGQLQRKYAEAPPGAAERPISSANMDHRASHRRSQRAMGKNRRGPEADPGGSLDPDQGLRRYVLPDASYPPFIPPR